MRHGHYHHAFWILLQYTLDDLSAMAERVCADVGLTGDQCLPLPVEDVIRGGLTAPSEEWQGLALARASEFSEKHAFAREITELVKSGKTSSSAPCVKVAGSPQMRGCPPILKGAIRDGRGIVDCIATNQFGYNSKGEEVGRTDKEQDIALARVNW